jgi:hypothetical protein
VAPTSGSNSALIRYSQIGPTAVGGEGIDSGAGWTVRAGASEITGTNAGTGITCAADFTGNYAPITDGPC